MKVTIIRKAGCPLCEIAVREFAAGGHDIELLSGFMDILDGERRSSMLADLLLCGGDRRAFPIVFVYDRFIPWQPKEAKGAWHGKDRI